MTILYHVNLEVFLIVRYYYTGLELGRKLKFNRTYYFNLGCREYRKVVIVHSSHEECRSDVGANTGFHW